MWFFCFFFVFVVDLLVFEIYYVFIFGEGLRNCLDYFLVFVVLIKDIYIFSLYCYVEVIIMIILLNGKDKILKLMYSEIIVF